MSRHALVPSVPYFSRVLAKALCRWEVWRASLRKGKAHTLLLPRSPGELCLAVQIPEQTCSPLKGEGGEVRKCQSRASSLLMQTLRRVASCIYASGSSQGKSFPYPPNAKASLV